MNPSIKDIQDILRIFLDSELQELRLEIGTVRLAVSRRAGADAALQAFTAAPAPVPAPAAASQPSAVPVKNPPRGQPEGAVVVSAPSVGTFYRCPEPHKPPFVEVGARVAAGDTLCLIEVMKMFTGVQAPCAGRVADILVEDATLIEHGQPLFYIEPA